MYVVTGATGKTGGAVVGELLRLGKPVRVIVRSESKGRPFAERGCQVVPADLEKGETLEHVFDGAKAVFVMNPPRYDVDLFETADLVHTAFVENLNAAGVAMVIALSSVGAHRPEGTGNILTTHRMEQDFESIKGDVTILRCAWFMTNAAQSVAMAAESGECGSFLTPLDRAIPQVDPADIGRMAATLMTDGVAGNRIVEFEGPEEVSPVDIAGAVAKALGRPVTATAIPEVAWRDIFSSAGMPPIVVDAWIEMIHGFADGSIAFEGGPGIEHRRGVIDIDRSVAAMMLPQQKTDEGRRAHG